MLLRNVFTPTGRAETQVLLQGANFVVAAPAAVPKHMQSSKHCKKQWMDMDSLSLRLLTTDIIMTCRRDGRSVEAGGEWRLTSQKNVRMMSETSWRRRTSLTAAIYTGPTHACRVIACHCHARKLTAIQLRMLLTRDVQTACHLACKGCLF